MGFVQVETSGQVQGTGNPSVTQAFDNPNVPGNVIVVIFGWENTGPDPSGYTAKNQYTALPIQQSGGHRSQVLLCRSCKGLTESIQLNFPNPGGDYPSISLAEYSAADVQAVMPVATGNSGVASVGTITVPSNSTVVMLTDTTQNSFAAGTGLTLRTNNGTLAPIRQAIADGVFSGSCTPQTTFGTAPWETTVFVLAPSSGRRESIANALFALLSLATLNGVPFTTYSRAAKIWSQVDNGQQPALYLVHTGETLVQKQPFGLTKYTFHFHVLIYLRGDADPSSIPDTLINEALQSIDNALQTTPVGEKQTLGGLVENAWIEGDTLIDPGILDQQVVAVVPIKVVAGL